MPFSISHGDLVKADDYSEIVLKQDVKNSPSVRRSAHDFLSHVFTFIFAEFTRIRGRG